MGDCPGGKLVKNCTNCGKFHVEWRDICEKCQDASDMKRYREIIDSDVPAGIILQNRVVESRTFG